MPSKRASGKFECDICGNEYDTEPEAQKCENGHRIEQARERMNR